MKSKSPLALLMKSLRHCNNGYMGCEVINGFMSLLEEIFNNEDKNKFNSQQFFDIILDEKISRFKT
jgi:hypothetical protein